MPKPPGSATKPSDSVGHHRLALVHRGGDPQLGEAGVRDLPVDEVLGDHADDLAPGGERGVRDRAHQADARAAVHQAHAAGGDLAAQRGRRVRVRRARAGLDPLNTQTVRSPVTGAASPRGCRPAARAGSLTRLNGRDPKNPRDADSGRGCTDSTHGTAPSTGLRPCASRPQSTPRAGRPGAASTSMARSVTASQPRPRCEAGAPGRTVRHAVEQHHALLEPRRQVTVRGRRAADVVDELLVDVDQALGSGRTSGATENDSPTACPGVG